MASGRRKAKRKKLMAIYKSTMKIRAKNPNAEMSECIKTATQLHNTAEKISNDTQIKKI